MHDKNINHVKPTVKIVWFTIKSQTIKQIQHGGGRRDRHFRSKFCYFKVWTDVLFYSKLVPMHACWFCLCYIKISFYCVIPYSEYREKNNMVLLKSYKAVTAMAVVLVAPPVNER